MKPYWLAFVAVVVLSFAVLGWAGLRIYQQAPPIPERVVTNEGVVVTDRSKIELGQNVWQALGGMQVGSIWGHGSYVAPDWSADWLHREAMFILERWANVDHQARFAALAAPERAALVARLTQLMRTNTYDAETRTLTIAPLRAEAYAAGTWWGPGCSAS